MADFALPTDIAWLQLGDWLKVLTANIEYQIAFAVLAFITFGLWRPLYHRFWIRIGGRLPGVQTYLPIEVDNYIERTRQRGRDACLWWAYVVFAYFTIVSFLNVYQQGNNYYDFPFPSHTVLSALAVGIAIWFATRALWECAPRWIEGKRGYWNEIRERCREMGCGYYEDCDDWKGWAGWELEDEGLLKQRNGYLKQHIAYVESKDRRSKKDEELLENRDKKVWAMLKEHSLEMSYWESLMGENLMEMRVPHIYQLGIQINHGHYRYLDFALLDPKTGEPVLGIETDEKHHFVEDKKNTPLQDFKRESHILEAVGIPIYRIPGAYWLRGLAPNDPSLKENQQRLLRIALRERDRITKEKRKQTRRRWLPLPLRRPP